MVERHRQIVAQGAGLGFLLSAILFVITWSPLAFLAILGGAAAGYLLGRRAPANVTARAVRSNSLDAATENALARWLAHPRLGARFACLLSAGLLLFLLAWSTGYGWMPEGALRSGARAQLEARGLDVDARSAFSEGLKIFLNNLLPFVLLVVANLIIRANGIPLGSIVPLYTVILYGLFLGTNSFLIPYPERMAPSFAILGRAGPYEMLALLLASAASARWSYYRVARLFQSAPERLPGLRAARAGEWIALVFALLLLAGAAFVEGAMVVGR